MKNYDNQDTTRVSSMRSRVGYKEIVLTDDINEISFDDMSIQAEFVSIELDKNSVMRFIPHENKWMLLDNNLNTTECDWVIELKDKTSDVDIIILKDKNGNQLPFKKSWIIRADGIYM